MRKILFLTALIAVPFIGGAKQAQAEEYCREYTKNVTVGGRAEQAYGTACYRPDGSWEIVSLEGSNYARDQVRNVMYNDIQRDTDRRYSNRPDRVVVVERYDRSPRYYRPHNRYRSIGYNNWPFVINFGNSHYNHGYKNHAYKHHYKHGHKYKNHKRHYHHAKNQRQKVQKYHYHKGKKYRAN